MRTPDRRRHVVRRRGPAVVLAASTLAAMSACGDAGRASPAPPASTVADAPTDPSVPVTSTSPSPTGYGDGVLTIGVLLPQTPAGSWIGNPGVNAAAYAVERINTGGGVFGENVVLVRADEGDDAESATAAIDQLIAAGVDAVVGPASSTVALDALDQLLSAGVLVCSPTASALLLDNYPDRDLFFRTIPSDSLQMAAIAIAAQRTGVEGAVVVYLDDEYGRGLADVVVDQLERRDLELLGSVGVAANGDTSDAIDLLLDHPDSAIIVLADAAQGMHVLSAIAASAPLLGGTNLPDIFVNDAVRPTNPEAYVALGPAVLESLQRFGPVAGLSPRQIGTPPPGDSSNPAPPLPAGPFALNTLDCINLIALAARQADSDDPEAIAGELRPTADDGAPCITFEQCAALLEQNRNIDYDGANEQNELFNFLFDRGDLARAAMMAYRVNASGVDEPAGQYIVEWG